MFTQGISWIKLSPDSIVSTGKVCGAAGRVVLPSLPRIFLKMIFGAPMSGRKRIAVYVALAWMIAFGFSIVDSIRGKLG